MNYGFRIRAVRELGTFHGSLEAFRGHRNLAVQILIFLWLVGVFTRLCLVDTLVLSVHSSQGRPFHLRHAPTSLQVKVPIFHQTFQGKSLYSLALLIPNRNKLLFIGHHGIPSVLWCEAFNSEGQVVLVAIHHMHVGHCLSEASLLVGVRISLILKHGSVVIKDPHVCVEGCLKQCRVARNVLQLIPTQLRSAFQEGSTWIRLWTHQVGLRTPFSPILVLIGCQLRNECRAQTKCFYKMVSHNLNLFDVKCALNIGLQHILWKRHARLPSIDKRLKSNENHIQPIL